MPLQIEGVIVLRYMQVALEHKSTVQSSTTSMTSAAEMHLENSFALWKKKL
jgi:hypothetical protein